MKKLYSLVTVICVGFLLISLAFTMLFDKVPPATIGVRQAMGGGSGITDQDYNLGYHTGITGVHKWHHLSKVTHFLDFSSTGSSGTPSLEIRAKDGNVVTLDVTVPYKIVPERGHKIVSEGLQSAYRDRVRSTIESVLRKQLTNMTSEDLQDTDSRVAFAEGALTPMNLALDKFHVEALSILFREIRFPTRYEQKLQEKQLLKQRALLDAAKVREEQARQETESYERTIGAEVKKKTADWEKTIQELDSRYDVEIAEIRATTELEIQKIKAEANKQYEILLADARLKLDEAEALRMELRNKALNTTGGRIWVAQKTAEGLQFDRVVLNANDPSVPKVLDLDEMTRLLVGEGLKAE